MKLAATCLLVALLFMPAQAEIVSDKSFNDFRVIWDYRPGLTQQEYIITVQNLQLVNREISISSFINETSFDVASVEEISFEEWKLLPYTYTVDHYDKIEHSEYDPGNNTWYTWNESVFNYSEIIESELLGYKPCKSLLFKKGIDDIRESYDSILIPKYDSKDKGDGTINGTKQFRLRFTTPIEQVAGGWGSSGRVSLWIDGNEFCPWWDATFDERREIHINNTAGDSVTDYQLKSVNLSSYNINATSARIVNNTSGLEEPFWNETVDASGNLEYVWANFSSISSGGWINITYYIYSQSTQTVDSVSNGTATFDFYDHFDTDKSKWTGDTAQLTISGSTGIFNAGGTSDKLIYATSNVTLPFIIESSLKRPANAVNRAHRFGARTSDGNDHIHLYFDWGINNNIRFKKAGGSRIDHVTNMSVGVVETQKIVAESTSSVRWYFDDVEGSNSPYTVTANIPTVAMPVVFSTYGTADFELYWVRARQYTANEPEPWSVGDVEYYTDSLHYNSTTNYNHTIESDGTITANQTVYSADDTNDTAQSTGTSYLIINVYNNTDSIVRNFTFIGDNIDWYQAANLSYGYTLNNASGVIESQNADGGLVNFTTDLIPGTYTIEIIQPPQNLTNITEQTQICYNWDDYANADYWNISQRIPSIPYTDVVIVLDGMKDAEFTDRAHSWILESPNPTGTNGDKELISWIRNSTTLSGYADGEDNDALNNDDSFKIMLDMTANNLTTDDRQFILSESGTVTAKRWGGAAWLPQATNAEGVVIGAGVAGSIQYEMQIPVSELTNFNNGSTIKLAMERKDTSQNPDIIKYYPKTLINDTDATKWTSINLTAESEYTFLGNVTQPNYTVTGLTPFTWYRHRFSTINGSSESSYVYSNDITEDSPQYKVSGYILTDADLPISGATVWSVCDCGCVCEVETSNATGYYQGDCFYNGTYTIYAIATGYLENSRVVIVNGANQSNQNITLTLPPSITTSPGPPVQYDELDLPLLLYIFIISFLYLFIVFRNGIAATELSLIYLLFIFFMLLFQTISLSVSYIYIPAFIFLFQISITGINLERKGGD